MEKHQVVGWLNTDLWVHGYSFWFSTSGVSTEFLFIRNFQMAHVLVQRTHWSHIDKRTIDPAPGRHLSWKLNNSDVPITLLWIRSQWNKVNALIWKYYLIGVEVLFRINTKIFTNRTLCLSGLSDCLDRGAWLTIYGG